MTHRPSTMAFGPGLHVFPGGAVDPGDGDGTLAARSVLDSSACAAAWAGDLDPAAARGHAVAAVRELYEEAGILLAAHADGAAIPGALLADALVRGEPLEVLAERLELVLRTDLLVPLSRWVTPPGDRGRRYDTRFFVAALPDGATVSHDAREVAAHEWLTPAAALAAAAEGRILLWPPTSCTLRALAPAGGIEDVRRHLAPLAAAPSPLVDEHGPRLVRVRAGAAGGIPGNASDTWLVGRERVVVVDPGDPNEEAAATIFEVVMERGGRVAAVVVTSGLPHLAGGAVGIALRAGVPLLASAEAARWIGEPAEAVGDGARIEAGDVALDVREVPGGRDGALVLWAADLDVVFTGGLSPGGPSRAIPEAPDAGAAKRAAAFLEGIRGRRLPARG